MAYRRNLIVNALYRSFYRLAYVMCLVFGFVFRPRVRAVCVAAWCDDALLTIRQSYARKFTLPGGLMRRGEVPRDAAIRELREEVGLQSAAQRLEASLVLSASHNFKRETVHYFDLHYWRKPRVEVDRREVVSAHFSSVDELTPAVCAPQLRAYLAERGYPRFKR
jgi:ADP-ribose pyrophosphatase YjhB (NUDIX family)